MNETRDRYTENENCMLTKYYDGSIISELSNEYILPDYLPDIKKIVHTKAQLKSDGKFKNGEKVENGGEVVYTVIYISDGNEIKSVTYSDEYNGMQNVPGMDENDVLISEEYVDQIIFRALNPRKISLRSRAVLHFRIYRTECAYPELNGTEEGIASLEKLEEEGVSFKYNEFDEKEINGTYDFESEKEIKDIIYCDMDFIQAECKYDGRALSVKCEGMIKYLYEASDSSINFECKRFPISHSFDEIQSYSDTEAFYVKFIPGTIKAAVNSNSFGENKMIETDFVYDINIFSYSPNSFIYSSDVFSTEYTEKSEYKNISPTHLNKAYKGSLSLNISKAKKDVGAENLNNIIDAYTVIKRGEIKREGDKNRLYVEATLEWCVLYSTSDGGCDCYCAEEPFRYEIEYNGSEYYDCNVDLYVLKCNARSDDNNLYLDVEAGIDMFIYQEKKLSFVSKCSLEVSTEEDNGFAPVTLCYASDKDTLWDIAKKYKVTLEDISKANPISKNDVLNGKVILIPKRKKNKALYSKVI